MIHYKITALLLVLILLPACSYTVLKSRPHTYAERSEQLDITYNSGVFSQITQSYNRKGKKSTHYKRLYMNQQGRVKIEEEFDGYSNSFTGVYVIIDDFLFLRNDSRDKYPELYLIRQMKDGFSLERISGEIPKDPLVESDILFNGEWLHNSRL